MQHLSTEKYIVAVQNPITLPDLASEPEPGLVIATFREDFYTDTHPTAKDIHLVIEVSNTTLSFDREVKYALYAEAGIPEYWIINTEEEQIEIFR